MKKFLLAALVAMLLFSCTGEFKETDIAPQWAHSSSTNYVFTELTNYDRYNFRVYNWVLTPMNGKVKQDAVLYLEKLYPGDSVYNESDSLIVISEMKPIPITK